MDDIEESVNDSVCQDQFLGSSKGMTTRSRISRLARMKTCSVSATKALQAISLSLISEIPQTLKKESSYHCVNDVYNDLLVFWLNKRSQTTLYSSNSPSLWGDASSNNVSTCGSPNQDEIACSASVDAEYLPESTNVSLIPSVVALCDI